MPPKMKVMLAVVAFLGAAPAASAKDSGLPKIDIGKTCRSNTKALGTSLGGEVNSTFKTCVEDEKTALQRIKKDWAGYPASAKTQCLHPTEYLPGYVEWQVCLEMTRDVRKKPPEPSAGNAGNATSSMTVGSSARPAASRRRMGPERAQCPIIKSNKDGSLAWVDACPLGPPY